MKAGKTVTLPDGRVIDGTAYLGEAKKGRIVTILGDTRKNANAIKLAQGADILVHESTYGKGEARMARNHYHSTNLQAVDVALEAGVGKLLLTHISARYAGKLAFELEKQAREIFAGAHVVSDFEEIEIPIKK